MLGHICLFSDGDFAFSILDENEEILSKVTELVTQDSPFNTLSKSLPLIHLSDGDVQAFIENSYFEKNFDSPESVDLLYQLLSHSNSKSIFEQLSISFADYEQICERIGTNQITYQPLLQLLIRYLVKENSEKLKFIEDSIRTIVEQPRLQVCLHEFIMCLKVELKNGSESEKKNALGQVQN